MCHAYVKLHLELTVKMQERDLEVIIDFKDLSSSS